MPLTTSTRSTRTTRRESQCSVARRTAEGGRRFPGKESPDFLIAVDPNSFGARGARKRCLPTFSAGASSDGQDLRKKRVAAHAAALRVEVAGALSIPNGALWRSFELLQNPSGK